MDWPVLILIGAVTWFGHAFLWTVVLNWTYGHGFPRRWQKRVRLLVALAVTLFPVLFWIVASGDPSLPNSLERTYLAICAATAVIYLPIISVARAFRRSPSEVIGDRSEIVDVAQALGDKPVGDGELWRLAALPRNQVFQVEFRELTLRLPRLPPEWDGLTILHVSDTHLCGTPGRRFYQHVFDRALQWGIPDILAVTGDVVDSHRHHRWIIPLIGRLKWSIAGLAILGNHDLYHEPDLVRRRLKRLDFHLLGNGWESIDVRGGPMIVVGNETPWFKPEPDLSGAPAEPFRLCLSHTPDNFGWAQRNRIDLLLAGHVHGGQIRLPGIGPLFVPSRYSRRYDCGQFAAGPTLMSISRGLSGGEPLRYRCRPEVTWIVLKKTEAQISAD
jgi:uncharacterized protein